MKNTISFVLQNKIFLVTMSAWMIAQCIKVVLGFLREHRFNFKWFVGTGGMPSSHAAGVSALATSVGFASGFDSVIFAVTLIFALITMFDAQGVRRASGKQAEILNKILDDVYFNRGVQEEKLKEFLGHTPVEVLIGSIIGTALGIIFYTTN